MKLIQTSDYLLFIDEKAEIKESILRFNSQSKKIEKTSKEDVVVLNRTPILRHDFPTVIAYRKLNEEAKELDLPLLPNPFNNDFTELALKELGYCNDLDMMTNESWEEVNAFIRGYKTAQAKQFSLEDIKKAFEEGSKHKYVCEANGKDKKCYCRSDNECNFANYITAEEYIQSLSTQQLPKEFIPEYEREHDDTVPFPKMRDSNVIKTIINSEGKEVLVGTYKY